jgi:hypothetical protein
VKADGTRGGLNPMRRPVSGPHDFSCLASWNMRNTFPTREGSYRIPTGPRGGQEEQWCSAGEGPAVQGQDALVLHEVGGSALAAARQHFLGQGNIGKPNVRPGLSEGGSAPAANCRPAISTAPRGQGSRAHARSSVALLSRRVIFHQMLHHRTCNRAVPRPSSQRCC